MKRRRPRSYWRPGIRKPGNGQTFMRERLDPAEPIVRPEGSDLSSKLALARCHVKWRAAVSQRRVKDFGFISLSKLRRISTRRDGGAR